jgi:signal transduction histidine kinase/ligand-binding sensor domain-containing protein
LKKIVLIALLIASAFLYFTDILYPTEYLHQTFDLTEGLPQSQVNCITQDQKGYLWIGTQYGLARFNGYEFRNFYSQDGLSSPLVSSLKVDSKGNIWIGTSRGFCQYDGNKFINYELAGAKFTDVQDIYINSRDEVYFVYSGGWGEIKDGKATAKLNRRFSGSGQLGFITGDDENTFYLASSGNVVLIVSNGNTDQLEIGDSSLHITELEWDKFNKRLWIGTDHGLYYYKAGKLSSIKDPLFNTQHNITALFIPDNKRIIIGIYGVGIYSLENDKLRPFFTGRGLLISCLYLDSTSNIWLGYDGRGLGRLSLSPFDNIQTASGILKGFVMSLIQGKNGDIWVATIGNGLYKFKDKDDRAPLNFHFGNNTASNSIRSIIEADDGSLWLGTMSGVINWNGKKQRLFTTADGITHQVIRDIYKDSRNVLWISTDNGITIYVNGQFKPFEHNNQLSHPMVRQIIQNKKGDYWIATLGDLYRYNGKQLEPFASDGALAGIASETIMFDSSENLWIGGIDSLTVVWRDGTFKRFGVEDGFESGTVYFLIEGDDGTIWVGTGDGIQYYRDGRFLLYNQQNGLVGNECNARACLKDNKGNLWFGLLEGISIYYDGKNFDSKNAQPVYFDDFLIDGEKADLKKLIEIPHTARNFVFHYHSINLNPAVRIKYRVRLHPAEIEWSQPSDERTKSYSYLGVGKYSFQVSTFQDSGYPRKNIAEIRFTIVPPIWKQLWFIILVSFLIAALIAIIISLRIHRLQHEKEQLREAIKERTQELQEKNRELESFAYTVSHDLKDPVGVIVGYTHVLEDFLKKQNVQGANQFIEGIKRNSDRIIRFIDDMLQLSRSGKVIEKLAPTDSKIIVSQIANDLMQKKKLKSNYLVMKDLPVVMADADRLYMIFYNLINNAYKYRDKKRSLKISVSCVQNGDMYQFAVKDNGIGIKEEDHKKIFQPGVRLKVVDTSGTGFGLRIVKKIVEAHGGKIWIESELGSGSTFYFTLKAVPIEEDGK